MVRVFFYFVSLVLISYYIIRIDDYSNFFILIFAFIQDEYVWALVKDCEEF